MCSNELLIGCYDALTGGESLLCEFVSDLRAAYSLDYYLYFGITEYIVGIMCYKICKRAVREIPDIKDMLYLEFLSQMLCDGVGIHCDNFRNTCTDYTES